MGILNAFVPNKEHPWNALFPKFVILAGNVIVERELHP